MESDEAAWGEKEGKRMHSVEGNSTVALVDGGIGEEKGAIKESTIHSVLDMITNLLPREVRVIPLCDNSSSSQSHLPCWV